MELAEPVFIVIGQSTGGISLFKLETPYADPHVRCCERCDAKTSAYSIACACLFVFLQLQGIRNPPASAAPQERSSLIDSVRSSIEASDEGVTKMVSSPAMVPRMPSAFPRESMILAMSCAAPGVVWMTMR